jgi:hypothetical protein
MVEENVSTVVTMSVRDVMESYAYNDADDFAQFVQSNIMASYLKPETMAEFVDLAIATGSSSITPIVKETINVGGVTFTDPEVSRILSGFPTIAPTTEDVPLSIFEQIIGSDVNLSLSIVGFCFICLCIWWVYYRHQREKQFKKEQSEDEYKAKMKAAKEVKSLYIDVSSDEDSDECEEDGSSKCQRDT